jgi:hypothetical protein
MRKRGRRLEAAMVRRRDAPYDEVERGAGVPRTG